MTDQRRRVRAIDLWLLDLALTAASFFFAYHLRVMFQVRGRTVMPFEVYAPSLVIIVLVWAIVLPVFRVYSSRVQDSREPLWQLTKALPVAWIVSVIAEAISIRSAYLPNWGSSKALLVFTLVINYFLLISYRLLLLRRA